MAEAVIFDKDGVLMLTETVWHRAFQDTLKLYGIDKEYTWEEHQKISGKPTFEVVENLRKEYGLTAPIHEYVEKYRARYKEIFREDGVEVPEGVKELLKKLKEEDIKVAIGTGSSRESCDLTLEKTGLAEFFDVVITSSDVAQSKPHPETFLLAARGINMQPDQCVVIGDSINDVLGARSAGMKVIAITDKSYIEDPELASPDLEVKGFKEITVEMIKNV